MVFVNFGAFILFLTIIIQSGIEPNHWMVLAVIGYIIGWLISVECWASHRDTVKRLEQENQQLKYDTQKLKYDIQQLSELFKKL